LLKFDGEITIWDHPNKSIEAKKIFGYIPETPALYDILTPWEHAEFIAKAYKLDAGWEDRAKNIFERLEIYDKKDKFTRELSKGMTQKLSIALALLIDPKSVLFDEPLVGLDPKAINEVLKIFGEPVLRHLWRIVFMHLQHPYAALSGVFLTIFQYSRLI
jgi:ABC-2 type transport system ATP-binding protein